jgi:hypothetical protein
VIAAWHSHQYLNLNPKPAQALVAIGAWHPEHYDHSELAQGLEAAGASGSCKEVDTQRLERQGHVCLGLVLGYPLPGTALSLPLARSLARARARALSLSFLLLACLLSPSLPLSFSRARSLSGCGWLSLSLARARARALSRSLSLSRERERVSCWFRV